jgi:4a-hydroxytetrahydrobiopterin dehydratase
MTPLVLDDEEITARLRGGAWRREGDTIVRDLKFDNFTAAIDFVDEVAAVAEEGNHHPDILVHGWNKVTLTLSTHSEGGLTELDFRMAKRLDALVS